MRKRTYDVGYGRPPKESRFKPGQSGNPKGRKPNPQRLLEQSAQVLSEPVTARNRFGQKQSLKMLEASYLVLCRRALDGDRSALLDVMRTVLLIGPQIDNANEAWLKEVEDARQTIYQKLGVTQEAIDNFRKGRSTSRRS